jgi:hypothetical protein
MSISYEWRFPFPHIENGRFKIGLTDYTFLGGSTICRKRKEFFLIRTDKIANELRTKLNNRFVDRLRIKEMFAISRSHPIKKIKIISRMRF